MAEHSGDKASFEKEDYSKTTPWSNRFAILMPGKKPYYSQNSKETGTGHDEADIKEKTHLSAVLKATNTSVKGMRL